MEIITDNANIEAHINKVHPAPDDGRESLKIIPRKNGEVISDIRANVRKVLEKPKVERQTFTQKLF